ncbi:MAG: glycosyltransferase family 4 protein [Deltaproteobacteria bacterium]|nr:glycosyltransferase family 4 protein [Deltaproteobacteria bacterium]
MRSVLYVSESYTPHDRRFLKAIGRQIGKTWFAPVNGSQVLKNLTLPPSVALWPGIGQPVSLWQELAERHDVHVVHAGPLNSVLPRIVGQIDRPLVGMSWGSDILAMDSETADSREQLLRNLLEVNALIVDCGSVLKKLDGWMPDLRIPTMRFPWGVELDRFRDLPGTRSRALRQGLGWTDNTVLISTRSWLPHYGIPVLVEAFSLLRERLPKVRLILAGDGPLRDEIRKQIKQLKLDGSIHSPGWIDEEELPVWYGASDFYISSSLRDGSSVSLLEAMACGLPVIVHREHGNLEWVRDGENGWLVDCASAKDICAAVLNAVSGKTRREEMGTANRKKIMKEADWERHAQNIPRAYRMAREHYQNRKSRRPEKNSAVQ